MNEIMLSFLMWISANSSYDTQLNLPNIIITEEQNMCALYGINSEQRCEGMKLRGFYDKRMSIYLRPDFELENPHHQSQLLHELIHYVQFRNKDTDNYCLGLLELEAYDLQDKWRNAQGLQPVLGDFNRLMLAASCNA